MRIIMAGSKTLKTFAAGSIGAAGATSIGVASSYAINKKEKFVFDEHKFISDNGDYLDEHLKWFIFNAIVKPKLPSIEEMDKACKKGELDCIDKYVFEQVKKNGHMGVHNWIKHDPDCDPKAMKIFGKWNEIDLNCRLSLDHVTHDYAETKTAEYICQYFDVLNNQGLNQAVWCKEFDYAGNTKEMSE